MKNLNSNGHDYPCVLYIRLCNRKASAGVSKGFIKKKKKAFVITVRKNNICHVIESLVGFKAKIKLSLTSNRTLPFFQHGQLIRLMCLLAHAHTGKKDNRQENK